MTFDPRIRNSKHCDRLSREVNTFTKDHRMATVPQQDEVPEPESHLSHVIIQKQLQDVILTQQAAYEKLKQSVGARSLLTFVFPIKS